MGHFNNREEAPVQEAYPQAPTVTAPQPVEYPTKDGPAAAGYPKLSVEEQTTRKQGGGGGDGFWERCCAMACCFCFLDCCYVESQNVCELVLNVCCSCPMYC